MSRRPDPDLRVPIEADLRHARWDRARARCEGALAEGIRDDFLGLTLARLAFVQHRRRDALRALASLLAEPRDPGTWVRAGELYAELGRPRAAERCWRRALAVDPSPRAWHRLVEALRHEGRHDEAASLRDRLLDRWPDDAWGLQDRAAELFAGGRLDAALAIYRRLPAAFDAFACAEILLRLGRDDEALEACRRAIERSPSEPWAHYRAAQIASRRGDPALALRFLADVPAAAEGPLAELTASLLREAGRPDEADPLLDRALGPRAAAIRARLRALEAGQCVLHGLRDKHRWRRLRVRPVLYLAAGSDPLAARTFAEAALRDLASFHHRAFGPHAGFTIDPLETREGDLDFAFFRHAVEHQSYPVMFRRLSLRARLRHECVVVLWAGDHAPVAEGYGGYGVAVSRCAPADAYAPTVLVHEFYHATLALQHTDGDKDVLEAGGIMGHPGGLNRLSDTYVSARHRALCATFPRALSLVRSGDRHEDADAWSEAARCYREALEIDPLYVFPAARLAQVEIHLGRYDEAERVMRRLLEVDDAPEHSSFLAHVLLDRGCIGKAREVIARMRGGGSERACLLAGFAWGMSWHYRPALAAFRAALRIHPQSMTALAGIAAAEASMGRLASARRTYLRLLARDPYWSEACDRLAVVEAERGDLRAARELLRRSASLKTPGGLHHWARARVLGWAGRWDDALASMRRSLREEPHTMGALLFEPWICVLLGRVEEAIAGFERCRRLESLSPCGRVAGAWVALLTHGEGLDAHRLALRRLASRERRLASLLHAQVLLGDPPEALRAAEPRLPATVALRRADL